MMPLNIREPNDKLMFLGRGYHVLEQLTVSYSFAVESKLAA
jgi:hypothetical protein